jgi:hypothetical protein
MGTLMIMKKYILDFAKLAEEKKNRAVLFGQS